MLCAIDGSVRSTDRAALSVDRSLAQQSVDRAAIGRSRSAIDRSTSTECHKYDSTPST